MNVILMLATLLSLNGERQLAYFPQPDFSEVRDLKDVPADAPTLAATGREVLSRASFTIPANGTLDLGAVAWEGRGVLLIEATLGGKPFVNHFLYGEIPFDYAQVKALLPYARERE